MIVPRCLQTCTSTSAQVSTAREMRQQQLRYFSDSGSLTVLLTLGTPEDEVVAISPQTLSHICTTGDKHSRAAADRQTCDTCESSEATERCAGETGARTHARRQSAGKSARREAAAQRELESLDREAARGASSQSARARSGRTKTLFTYNLMLC